MELVKEGIKKIGIWWVKLARNAWENVWRMLTFKLNLKKIGLKNKLKNFIITHDKLFRIKWKKNWIDIWISYRVMRLWFLPSDDVNFKYWRCRGCIETSYVWWATACAPRGLRFTFSIHHASVYYIYTHTRQRIYFILRPANTWWYITCPKREKRSRNMYIYIYPWQSTINDCLE